MSPKYAAPEPASVTSWWQEMAALELATPKPRGVEAEPEALLHNDNPAR